MKTAKRRRWPFVLGGIVAALAAFLLLFDWNWFKPLVERQASAALGRQVSIADFHVDLGRVPRVVLGGVRVANPPDWPGGGDFATIERLAVDVDAMAYIRDREIVVPRIVADRPVVEAVQTPEGKANWTFDTRGGAGDTSSSGPSPKIGALQINEGRGHVVVPKLEADFTITAATREQGGESVITAEAQGTYAGQPITGRFTGGALLNLRDADKPYPVDLHLANGPTKLSLVGTVQDPLNFRGADLTADLSGPNMAHLLPLTGIAVPPTPPYQITGKLDYEAGRVRFTDARGKVGDSDVSGKLEVDTNPAKRPVLTAELQSRSVNLDDLGGFIGSTPGRVNTPGQTPEQRRAVARAEASKQLIPDTPISLPKLTAMDVHLTYEAKSIKGRNQPLDSLSAKLDIEDGAVKVTPLKATVGKGTITGQIELTPQANATMRAKADIDFKRLDLDKLLAAAGVARGAGVIGGQAVIEGTGKSLADILGHGNGQLKLYMSGGGNVSALLVDLSGLQLGNALLSALGIPSRARIQCFIADFVLRNGVATARTLVLDTDEDRVAGKGTINLRNERLDLTLETDSKNFTVGSLPAPIEIGGTLKNPTAAPDAGALAARAGAAVGLGVLLTPLAALLPTIELGIGEDGACVGLLRAARAPARVPAGRSGQR